MGEWLPILTDPALDGEHSPHCSAFRPDTLALADLEGQLPAVDHQLMAGDEARIGGGKEGHRRGHLFRLAKALHGDLAQVVRGPGRVLARGLREPRLDQARADAVDANL